ncbi:hypothetical protein ACWCYY_11325 [Kitasatospora sp. NPDC001664]
MATASPTFVEALASLTPDATMVRLSSGFGGFPRTAAAYDASGRAVPQSLTIRQALARWIVQDFPGLDSQATHELDLGTGRLTAVVPDTACLMAA